VAGTSALFLISKPRITSAQQILPLVLENVPKLPQPDWSLLHPLTSSAYQTRGDLERTIEVLKDSLRKSKTQINACEGIIEGANAQLVLKGMYNSRLSKSLFTKENKKKKDKVVIYPEGNRRLLTDEAWIKTIEDAKQAREADELAVGNRKVQRLEKKARKVELEAKWVRVKEQHLEKVAHWEAECERLKGNDVAKKNFPKRPVQAKKPKATDEDEVPDDPSEISVALGSRLGPEEDGSNDSDED
ncbi:hypothetical protein B0H10DRAFT_1840242, partial [Mycena sp. CBHHK59/15]